MFGVVYVILTENGSAEDIGRIDEALSEPLDPSVSSAQKRLLEGLTVLTA